jgi:formamidopyrimidine-DNA glycosylase
MPELPEVETVCRDLSGLITGKKIAGVWSDLPRSLRDRDTAVFAGIVNGATVSDVKRRAKQILIHLSNNRTIIVHLKMTGQLVVKPSSEPVEKGTHVIIEFDDDRDLRFRDVRTFGYMDLAVTDDIGETGEKMPGLGPEPLDRRFTQGVFDWIVKKHPGAKIKALLLNQSAIAGIGNIYADEILHYAGVRPGRRSASLTAAERGKLYKGIRKILPAAIEQRGSSIRDFIDGSGQPGGYVPHLKAYGRTGESCAGGCGSVIKKTKVAGRSSHYCPKCQR